ncbi:DUF6153 family protein [Streptomyces litchfieldiae]|uniref:DUF6153 family protein n=1 Tax=Streptomyces litchfieldiae TaxID=3075543 RepID=A0ABU2MUB5_9ACTN|nr:DUF6153 family protein [Streptomyces sp. DSM 44938]MDT0344423.1 DUF6153 family protein [Streptomyces sp. DSM 44938]
MSPQRWTPVPLPRKRAGLVLLLFGVLLGIVAMHGLSSVPGPGPGSEHVRAMDDMNGMEDMGGEHAHDEAPGHAEHADADCVASGVSGGPQLPVVLPAGVPSGAGEPCAAARAVGNAPGGRAPPSLSELQLLRI